MACFPNPLSWAAAPAGAEARWKPRCSSVSQIPVALEHQGEFRGWAAAMLYKDELYGTFERKNKELGPFKVFAYLLYEKWFISPEVTCI